MSLSELKKLPAIADVEHNLLASLMHVACLVGDGPVVQELLNLEIDPCAVDERGQSAVNIAASAAQEEILSLILTNGQPTDVAQHIQRAKERVLHLAASEGSISICKRLLKEGVMPDVRLADGLTAVHHAVHGGFHAIIRLFRVHAPLCAPLIQDVASDESSHSAAVDILPLHGDFVIPSEDLLHTTGLSCAGSGMGLQPKPLVELHIERVAEPIPLLVIVSDYRRIHRSIDRNGTPRTTPRATPRNSLTPRDEDHNNNNNRSVDNAHYTIQDGVCFNVTFVGCDGTHAQFPNITLWELRLRSRVRSTAPRPGAMSPSSSVRSLSDVYGDEVLSSFGGRSACRISMH